MNEIVIIIPETPVAKARARVTRTGTYTPLKTKNYEKRVIKIMQEYMKINKLSIMDGPIIAQLSIEVIPPASWSEKKKKEAIEGKILPTVKPDLDNYKTIFDAANNVLYYDDSQVIAIQSRKIYAAESRAIFIIQKHPFAKGSQSKSSGNGVRKIKGNQLFLQKPKKPGMELLV